MLSIVYKGIAIPIFWDLLDKRGNSNATERKELLNKFIHCFGIDKIEYVLADREFVGKEWFTYLNDMGIKFCIRIKKNNLVNNTKGDMVQVQTLFRNVNKYECFINLRTVTVDGCKVKLSAKRNSDNELVIVATNDLKYLHGIDLYAKRWQIETLFSCFKSRGFGLEDTHLTDQAKMKKLVAIFSIAFCWCYKIGIKQHNEKPITIKNHGRATKSLFRLGLDFFQEKFRAMVVFTKHDYFDWLLDFLMIDINTISLISNDN